GGVGSRGVTRYDYPSVSTTVSAWVERDGCPEQADHESNGDVAVDRWTGCKDGTEVVLYSIEGGGHSWPGGQRMSRLLDPPSQALDATSVIWDFFTAHPKRG